MECIVQSAIQHGEIKVGGVAILADVHKPESSSTFEHKPTLTGE